MNSPIKLPSIPYELLESLSDGEVPLVRAYAEQAVRDALAAQVPVAWMTDDGRVSTDETKRTAMAAASRPFFYIPLAIIPENNHE